MRLLCTYIAALAACHRSEASDAVDLGPAPAASSSRKTDSINPRLLRRFRALEPAPVTTDPVSIARVKVGTELFFDRRLSAGGETSCDTCHAFDRGGADPRPTSVGSRGAKGTRNAPTVFNAAWHVAQFWDGREPDVEHQAGGPILNPKEMAMRGPEEVTAVLRSIPGYVDELTTAFGPETVDFTHATLAIAAFERTLRTPARWDAYLAGTLDALTAKEKEGLKLFADIGCVQCHTGELVGGSMFQKAGAITPWPNQSDQGRFEVTHLDADRMVFKVPSLRNVALTAPYFHDGSVSNLSEAVRMMGRYQLGIQLDDGEIEAIVAWLGSLTGAQPVIARPKLPADGPDTAGLVTAR